MDSQVFLELVRRLESSFAEMRSDFKDMKETFVSYKDHEHTVETVKDLKARVKELERGIDKNAWMVKVGDKVMYGILGGALMTLLKLLGLF